MRVKLLHDTFVKYQKDTILEVTDEEGKRLIAFLNAEKVEAEKPKAEKKMKGKK